MAMANANPLLAGVGAAAGVAAGDFTIKKKWYEDTVFRNQAKDEVRVCVVCLCGHVCLVTCVCACAEDTSDFTIKQK